MAAPLKSWHAPDARQAAQLLRHQVGTTRDMADSLIRQVEQAGPVEFVAQLLIHTDTTPLGQHAGAKRWKLSFRTLPACGVLAEADCWQLDLVERDVQPHAASRESRQS
jgi:hypothetical protein